MKSIKRYVPYWDCGVCSHRHRNKQLAIECQSMPKRFPSKEHMERDKEIYELRADGLTYRAIGTLCGLSKSRVAQIVRKIKKENGHDKINKQTIVFH